MIHASTHISNHIETSAFYVAARSAHEPVTQGASDLQLWTAAQRGRSGEGEGREVEGGRGVMTRCAREPTGWLKSRRPAAGRE